MKTIVKIFIVSIALSFTGCEDVISVDLDTAAPKLVIDASIDWIKNTPGNEQKIKLTTTTGFYSTEIPTVSGATVTVTNSLNTVFTFVETPGTGEYTCSDFVPVIGETYNMTITLNGETYTASETLLAAPDIEQAVEQNSSGGISGDEVEITYRYQDDGALENFYLSRVVSPRVIYPVFEVEDDNYSNGSMMAEAYSHEDLKPGDLLNIRLYGISKRYHMYFSKLLTASGDGNGPFPTIPTAVRGNIVNQTNAENFAFGYFRLAEVAVKDYTIQ